MERIYGTLYEAAREGNTQILVELLGQDPLILDRFMTSCPMSDTPLHIAAMLGHTDFVKEILNTKPELVRELNSEKSSPLHLASTKGYVNVVKALALTDSNLCSVHDAKGRNPLHLAAMKGHVEVLGVLVQVNRNAALATMGSGGENILHVAVKYKQLKTAELLVGVLGDDHKFLNAKDNYGMTILHRAVLVKQVEIINFLLMNTRIEVNAVNANGFTALDILKQSERDVRDFEIGESLRIAGAITSSPPQLIRPEILPLPSDPNKPTGTTKPQTQAKITGTDDQKTKKKKENNWLTKKRESLMVVASLLATMGFQAAITPPGGLWQDDSVGRNPTMSSSAPMSPASQSGIDLPHLAGSSIMAEKHKHLYDGYIVCNTIGFLASLSIILLLITGLPCLKRFCMWLLILIMWVAITAMALTYMFSIMVSTTLGDPNTPGSDTSSNIFGLNMNATVTNVLVYSIVSWIFLMVLLVFMHTVRILFLFIGRFVRLFKPKKRRSPLPTVVD